ncbi:MAG: class 1 fructose-bisphosphatase [Hyphomicrobiaceae bacterium]|nr:class 1 fructose-bisphosphatase [Hyphomicrobiaceae bacterium]
MPALTDRPTSLKTDGACASSLTYRLMSQAGRNPECRSAAKVVLSLARAATELSLLLGRGPLGGAHATATGNQNVDGDVQKSLDVLANDMIVEALRRTPTAYYASEEEDAILTLAQNGLVAVAVDPLDGSSNIDSNVSIGTIFSIFPTSRDGATASFFRPGSEQLAAGYFIYGPHTALVLTTGHGTDVYVLDPLTKSFSLAAAHISIPRETQEFAINASNYRHWFDPVRTFIDDCYAGAEGPHAKDFNMRWIASLVAETHRIFMRGGVFLYPADARKGYQQGRLRLIYEAAPIAFLVEQAGGFAIDGPNRILDLVPTSLHQRTPLHFGSADKVNKIRRYHEDPAFLRRTAPLFNTRGLFNA